MLIGNGGAELGVRGYVSAYNADDGKLAWRFYITPNPEGKPDGAASDKILAEKAGGTWFGDGWKKTGGGGTPWDSITYDPITDLLYVGTGNGSPWSHEARSNGKGDNLFLSSILALKPDTGEYVWHYQTTPGDSWDYTATQHIMTADLVINGEKRHVVMQAPKNGFFYVLDAASGKLISAEKYAGVNWAEKIDLATGRPVDNPRTRYLKNGLSRMGCRSQWWSHLAAHGLQSAGRPGIHSRTSRRFYLQARCVMAVRAWPLESRARRRIRSAGTAGQTARGENSLPQAKQHARSCRPAVGYLIAWDPVKQQPRWITPEDNAWDRRRARHCQRPGVRGLRQHLQRL